MNALTKTSLVISAAVIALVSCHGTKKNAQTASATPAATTAPPAPATPQPAVAAPTLTTSAVRNGIIPGELELQAIRQKYPETTAQNLSNGHELYIGTCTDCHRKKNIFAFSESRWKDIIDDMADRSKLNAQQKDDLYKYVLSMKATQNSYAR